MTIDYSARALSWEGSLLIFDNERFLVSYKNDPRNHTKFHEEVSVVWCDLVDRLPTCKFGTPGAGVECGRYRSRFCIEPRGLFAINWIAVIILYLLA